ncbi:transposase InsO family protein [Methylorubrum extorquens]|nr:transposase InsO family protein [Methylorubrum extorquens]MCP1591765.1 transposase InsO family protein [Methylorubrum extorquens]
MVLLVHGGAPRLDRSAIMPPLPPRRAPRIPHLAPERRRQAVDGIREKYGLSERHACRIVGQHRGTQRYVPTVPADEDDLTRAVIALASEYGRYGYRRVTALLQADGWQVGKDRVQRIWRREGLKVPSRHRPRSRLWLSDGSCVRLRPLRRNHVWSFDFVQAQTELCGRLGDDGVLKAAYRGGCRSLPEPLSESDTPWRHLPTSSGFVSPKTSTIP